jgi:RNA polymerase sigma-70 factor (ECF subfamily)
MRYRRGVDGAMLIRLLGERGATLAAEEVDGVIAAVIADGEARLPHRPVSRDAFVTRIAEAVRSAAGPIELATLHALAGADLYLAAALAARDPQALAIAESELIPSVRRAAAGVDGNAAFIDEVVQRVREKLLVGDPAGAPGIASYCGRGPLGRWVRVIATRVAVDLKRKDARIEDDADAIEELPAPDDPELALVWQTSAEHCKRALTAAFEALSKRDRTLLRQRYLDGLDINALGRIYGVHPSTAFRWVQQIEQKLATSTRTALMEQLALSESQVHSLERLVASQLHVSMTRLLRGGRVVKRR